MAEDNPYYDAVYWAYGNGLVGGTTDTEFSPDHSLTREQVCTILTRFAALEGISLIQAVEPEQFKDSLEISDYARSGVTACQMAGVVKGYEDNFFYPQNTMTKEECAAVVYRVMVAADMTAPEGSSLVDLTPGAYDSLYDEYKDITFTALVPASEEEGPTSFFDQAVFIGDSISMTLESYCAASGALGGAKFLCAGSMSPTNMLTGKILPEYPKGSGQHPKLEDAIAAAGAKKVYLMLGMNCIAGGVDRACQDLVTLVGRIQAKSPDTAILIQSVTPMTADSPRADDALNNTTIQTFNQQMQTLCQEKGWYFVNVAEALSDESGFLRSDFSGDKAMGIHLNYNGAKAWADYLLTHVPQALK